MIDSKIVQVVEGEGERFANSYLSKGWILLCQIPFVNCENEPFIFYCLGRPEYITEPE